MSSSLGLTVFVWLTADAIVPHAQLANREDDCISRIRPFLIDGDPTHEDVSWGGAGQSKDSSLWTEPVVQTDAPVSRNDWVAAAVLARAMLTARVATA